MRTSIFSGREERDSTTGFPAHHIGKYEIVRETGASKQARVKVYLAYDSDLERPVLVKAVAENSDKRLADQFRREVAAIAKLRAPHVISIYELGEHEGLPFAAMQHAGDDHLEAAIRSRRNFTLLEKIQLMEQVAAGAAEAHRAGLSYIGLQPSGIALTRDGGAVIQDFGVVRLSTGQQTGNGLYAAPEDARPGAVTERLSDIFGFGVICHELLTGSHPFREEESEGCDWAAAPEPLSQLLPRCPEALERVVTRAMAKSRELRHQSFEEIQEELRPILRTLKRTRASELWADGRRLIRAEKLPEAQEAVREALQLDPDDADGQQVSRDLRVLVERQKTRKKIEELWREADDSAAHRRFFAAVDLLEAAARLDETEAETKSRLEAMRARLGASVDAARLSSEARALQDSGELEEAQAKAIKAIERDPQDPEARGLLKSIQELAERRERDARSEEGIARAKSLAEDGSFEEARAVLATLQADDPDSPLIRQWIDYVEGQERSAEKQRRLEALTREAEFLLFEKRYGEAIALIEASAPEFPGDPGPAELLTRARHEMERAAVLERASARCNQFCQSQRFDQAYEALEEALAALPGEPALLDLRRRVDVQARNWQRAARVREALELVGWLIEQDRPDLAARFLKKSLAGVPDEAALAARLKDVEGGLRDWEQRRFLDVLEEFAAERGPRGERRVAGSALLPVLEEALKAGAPGAGVAEAAENLRRRLREEVIIAEARRYLAAGDPDQAEQALKRGITFLGDTSAAKSLELEIRSHRRVAEEQRAAQILLGQRKLTEAEQALRRLAAADRPEIEGLLNLVREVRAASDETAFRHRVKQTALLLARQGKLEEAECVARRLATLYPGEGIWEEVKAGGRGGIVSGGENEPVRADATAEASKPRPTEQRLRRAPRAIRYRPAASQAAVLAGVVLALAAAGAGLWKHSSKPAATATTKPAPIPEKPRSLEQAPQAVPPSDTEATQTADLLEQSSQEHIASLRMARAALAPKPIQQQEPTALRAFRTPASRMPAERAQNVDLPAPPTSTEGLAHQGPAELAIGQGLASPPLPTPKVTTPAPKAAAPEPVSRPIHRGLVQPARLISAPAPRFPVLAANNHVSGVVGVDAVVDKQGRVKQVTAVRGNPLLTTAAKQAVMQWRYEPATVDGEPVEAQVTITVRFTER